MCDTYEPMLPLTPPSIRFEERVWSAQELTGLASCWSAAVRDRLPTQAPAVALVLTNHPSAVALLFALSSLPLPLVLLPPDRRAWRSVPAIPPGIPLVAAPTPEDVTPRAESFGLRVIELPEAGDVGDATPEAPSFFSCPGMVFFTSGSTGPPKPVFRRTVAVVGAAVAFIEAFGLTSEDGVLGTLPLTATHGLTYTLVVAARLGSTLGLSERFDPHAALLHFRSGCYRYWAGVPVMADALVRAAGGPRFAAPPLCVVAAGRLPELLFQAFRTRFGVPLRGQYGATECGIISVDASPARDVRPGTVGRAVPGVDVRIGDGPDTPTSTGQIGRIWIRSPWLMEGYGFPPAVERPECVGDWWAAQDVGSLDQAGYLTLRGRTDDCVKTSAGYLVNLADVTTVLGEHPDVLEVVAVPLATARGMVLGVLVEASTPLDSAALRRHMARTLPPWAQPRVVETTRELPRLARGKIDRAACVTILTRSLAAGEPS